MIKRRARFIKHAIQYGFWRVLVPCIRVEYYFTEQAEALRFVRAFRELGDSHGARFVPINIDKPNGFDTPGAFESVYSDKMLFGEFEARRAAESAAQLLERQRIEAYEDTF